jgi:Asp-tRNA(Asn)/Glu-tRNA(Gln) amidotransferase A subunit family amidase
MKGFVSNKDAFQVKRVREAGAMCAQSRTMAEWAFSPYETVSSILPGYTRNPTRLDRVTAGRAAATASGKSRQNSAP